MAKKFLVPIDLESYIDLNKNELRNAVLQNLSTAPSSPSNGQIYYDTDDNKMYLRANGAWEIVNRSNATTGADGYMSSSDKTKIDSVESSADVTDATNVNAAGAVMESDFDATTFLYATSDNTPQAKTVAQVRTILNVEDGSTADQTAAEILTLLLTVDGTGTGLDADKVDGQEGSHYLARANHTGTQVASTISNFDAQVRGSRLDQMASPTASTSMNSQRLTSVGTPTSDTDAATKAYVDATKAGLNVKDPVRVASTANVTISSALENGDAIDGVTLATGDRVLLKDQSTGAENGIYVVVSSGTAGRATDFDSTSEAVGGAFVWVNEGTANADTQWVVTTNDPITLGTTALTWTHYASATGVTAGNGLSKSGSALAVNLDSNPGLTVGGNGLKVADTLAGGGITLTNGVLSRDTIALGSDVSGALPIANGGTAGTSAAAAKTNLGFTTKASATLTGDASTAAFTVTHSLGTRDVDVTVYTSASPYSEVEVDIAHATTNTVTITFATAPASGTDYRAVVIG
jgi:hypothetical protein